VCGTCPRTTLPVRPRAEWTGDGCSRESTRTRPRSGREAPANGWRYNSTRPAAARAIVQRAPP